MTKLADHLTRTAEQHEDRGARQSPVLLSGAWELAAYTYPRAVWIVHARSKARTGKTLRREVSAPNGGLT